MLSKPTLNFVVHQPNRKYLIFPITERIYVVIQKCKQINNFFRQLCDSQIVVSIISKFTYFGKNVNKQLKSADFFAEMWKFQKSLLMKFLSFFIVILKHTLIFVVHQPIVKYLVFPITERIYVVKQKCKQITIFFRWLCISHIVL